MLKTYKIIFIIIIIAIKLKLLYNASFSDMLSLVIKSSYKMKSHMTQLVSSFQSSSPLCVCVCACVLVLATQWGPEPSEDLLKARPLFTYSKACLRFQPIDCIKYRHSLYDVTLSFIVKRNGRLLTVAILAVPDSFWLSANLKLGKEVAHLWTWGGLTKAQLLS